MSIVGWLVSLAAALMFINAAVALAKGKISFGWVFEPIIADRTKDPFSYWFMLLGSIFVGLFCIGIVCYKILFPAT